MQCLFACYYDSGSVLLILASSFFFSHCIVNCCRNLIWSFTCLVSDLEVFVTSNCCPLGVFKIRNPYISVLMVFIKGYEIALMCIIINIRLWVVFKGPSCNLNQNSAMLKAASKIE